MSWSFYLMFFTYIMLMWDFYQYELNWNSCWQIKNENVHFCNFFLKKCTFSLSICQHELQFSSYWLKSHISKMYVKKFKKKLYFKTNLGSSGIFGASWDPHLRITNFSWNLIFFSNFFTYIFLMWDFNQYELNWNSCWQI